MPDTLNDLLENIDVAKGAFPIASKMDLDIISHSHTLRCDAKQSDSRFELLDSILDSVETFQLGDFLPITFIKGRQPTYIDPEAGSGIPVINTLSIQNLSINIEDCRHISEEDYENLEEERRLVKEDVLLTMDGGTSIGKPVVFNLDGDFTVDSHVAILRPEIMAPKMLVYLLASPLGQIQFKRAESGASGQTAVTEENVRRFKFPVIEIEDLDRIVTELDGRRTDIEEKRSELKMQEEEAWKIFFTGLLSATS